MGSIVYLTKEGFVSIDNSLDMGTDVDNPILDSTFYYLLNNNYKYTNIYYDEYEKLIYSDEFYYFGVSYNNNKYYLDKRTSGNYCVLYKRKSPLDDKDVFKKYKKEVLEIIRDLNDLENDKVYDFSLYSFDGDLLETYFSVIGDYNKKYHIFGKKAKNTKSYFLRDGICFDDIVSYIGIDNKKALDYFISDFETEDLGNLIEININGIEEIFSKEEFLTELKDFVFRNSCKKVWNNMMLSIIDSRLSRFC